MRRHSHPLICSDSVLVFFDAADSGDCRLQPADIRILLPLSMASAEAAPPHSRKMAAGSDFAVARPGNIEQAWSQDAVVLGYDAFGNPWLWPDRIRVMQG